jgi:hypothetical protein
MAMGVSLSDSGPEFDADIVRLLRKANVAHSVTFRYSLEMKFYLLSFRHIAELGRYGDDQCRGVT